MRATLLPHGEVIEAGKIHIIDFGESRQFETGPGHQPAVDLIPGHRIDPPLPGMTRLDPYSWDIYCLGLMLRSMLESRKPRRCDPWVLHRYTHWLIGNERGCTGVCHCRPTARRAH
ncbi:hypothetical protein C8Q74DRAFT_1268333 [Fomes fomentarius]|nr:hypothetical protein C8Q74DRAFT_1268333 [Fomes fomentarius]